MMTAKEKAKELVEKYWHNISGVPNTCGVDLNSKDTYILLAKQCALITVGEIIDVIKTIAEGQFYESRSNEIKVDNLMKDWQQVKEEIRNGNDE